MIPLPPVKGEALTGSHCTLFWSHTLVGGWSHTVVDRINCLVSSSHWLVTSLVGHTALGWSHYPNSICGVMIVGIDFVFDVVHGAVQDLIVNPAY